MGSLDESSWDSVEESGINSREKKTGQGHFGKISPSKECPAPVAVPRRAKNARRQSPAGYVNSWNAPIVAADQGPDPPGMLIIISCM